MINKILNSFWVKRFTIPPEILYSYRFAEALEAIKQRWPDEIRSEHNQNPIFIIATGWGCGSTLMQRILVSSCQVAFWGEPLDHALPVQRLTSILSALTTDWPLQKDFINLSAEIEKFSNFSDKWIASLTPPLYYLIEAHRAFFLNWFSQPAQKYGLSRWGIKEVRWTIYHARYLKILFPNAKFIFLCRNLFDSYRSCKGRDWYISWPDYKMSNIFAFAHHWKLLVEGFMTQYQEIGGMFIKYEDLISDGYDFSEILKYLSLNQIDKNVLQKKIGARGKKNKLTYMEKFILKNIAHKPMKKLGYL